MRRLETSHAEPHHRPHALDDLHLGDLGGALPPILEEDGGLADGVAARLAQVEHLYEK